MPAKPSKEIKTRTIHSVQKNGDIYILERKTIYDPDKRYNKVLSTKLISKIPKGTEIPVPTRPKRSKSENKTNSITSNSAHYDVATEKITAHRQRIGMMNIIDHIGTVSGIDEAIYQCADQATAQKIISIARYLLATKGQTLPGISTWQYNHPLPYAEGISEDIYHQLFVQVGRDETLQQNFFLNRCETLGGKKTLAYDSTTFSTYSENQIEARYGFNKAGDGLKTIKYLALYSIETRQPVAFTKQPGNLSDVDSLENALVQLESLGVSRAEIVTDNGYYSEKNLSTLFLARFHFITLARVNLKWIKQEIDTHLLEFEKLSNACPFDLETHGITISSMREFVKTRKYNSAKTGIAKGEQEVFRKRVYLHIFFNAMRKVSEDQCFERELLELKEMLENGRTVDELDKKSQSKVEKYLTIKTRGTKTSISFNEKTCAVAKKYHGYFALVSNSEKELFQALAKYRKREYIEGYFRSAKQYTDSERIRVWDSDTLRGRMFVQFIALCYYEYLNERIRQLKGTLGVPNGDATHDTKINLEQEKKLKSWLNNTPLYLQLQWFDAIEGIEISNALKTKRWTTEITSRDRMYLEKLGLKSEF